MEGEAEVLQQRVEALAFDRAGSSRANGFEENSRKA